MSKKPISAQNVMNLAILTFPLLSCGNAFANDAMNEVMYPPLPQYGFIQFNSAVCIATGGTVAGLSGTTNVSWSAVPGGYGYPASQYICSGSLKITEVSGANAGRSCTRSFSSVAQTSGSLITDGAGFLNPGGISGLIAGTTGGNLINSAPTCTGVGLTAGVSETVTAFVACGLPIGGGLDTLLTGTAATCIVN